MENEKSGIWLSVSHVRHQAKKRDVFVQLEGDRADREPEWWPVLIEGEEEGADLYRSIAEALDKNQAVRAFLSGSDQGLTVTDYRIQYGSPR